MTRSFNKETPHSHMNLSELLQEKEEKEAIKFGILDDNGDLVSGLRITPKTLSIEGRNIKLDDAVTQFDDWFNLSGEEEKEAIVYDDILDNLHELTVESMEDLIADIKDRIKEASVPFETPEDNLGKGEDTYKQGELQDDGGMSYENEPTITIHLDTADFEEKIDKLINSLKEIKEIKEDETFDNLFGKALSHKPVPEPLRLHEQLDKARLDKIESDITTINNEVESNKITTDNDVTKLKAELTNAVRDIATNASDIALLKEYVL